MTIISLKPSTELVHVSGWRAPNRLAAGRHRFDGRLSAVVFSMPMLLLRPSVTGPPGYAGNISGVCFSS